MDTTEKRKQKMDSALEKEQTEKQQVQGEQETEEEREAWRETIITSINAIVIFLFTYMISAFLLLRGTEDQVVASAVLVLCGIVASGIYIISKSIKKLISKL